MTVTIDQLHHWMKSREHERLEFKEAKSGYDSDTATKYCCALANEGGGHLVLGLTDKLPRSIVGSHAFTNLEDIKSKLIQRLQLRIDVDELLTDKGRVLVFSVPSRPIGVPIQYNKIYWMRRGEELVAMTSDMLKRIFNEGEPDFSALVCANATFKDLNPEYIPDAVGLTKRPIKNCSSSTSEKTSKLDQNWSTCARSCLLCLKVRYRSSLESLKRVAWWRFGGRRRLVSGIQ